MTTPNDDRQMELDLSAKAVQSLETVRPAKAGGEVSSHLDVASNVIPFDVAVRGYRRIQEQEILRDANSWANAGRQAKI